MPDIIISDYAMAKSPLHNLIDSLYELTSQGRVNWTPMPDGVYEIRVNHLAILLNSNTKNFIFLSPLGRELANFSFNSLKEAAARGESRYCEICNQLLELVRGQHATTDSSQSDSSSHKVKKVRTTKAKTSSGKSRSKKEDDTETVDVAQAIRNLADKINESSEDES